VNDTIINLESLESSDTYLSPIEAASPPPSPSKRPGRRRNLLLIGLAIFLLLGGVMVLLLRHKPVAKPPTTVVINTQSLSSGTLQKIEHQQAGSVASEQLTIAAATLFKSNVDVQGETSLAKNLQVGGNLSVNQNATIGKDLSVSGTITAGSLSVSSLSLKTLRLSGDLNVGGHIIPSGAKPAVAISVAAANGSATIDGNDISGTVTITTGSGTQNAGELAIISFSAAYGTNPRVQLTAVNAASAALLPYVSQSPRFFSIETANLPAAGISYVFNYLITQ
jgi:hypothetical protein